MKQCSKCGQRHELSDFKTDKRNKDGKGAWCSKCQAEYDRRYYQTHKAAHDAYTKRWVKEHPERARQLFHAANHRYYHKHKEKVLARLQVRIKTIDHTYCGVVRRANQTNESDEQIKSRIASKRARRFFAAIGAAGAIVQHH